MSENEKNGGSMDDINNYYDPNLKKDRLNQSVNKSKC